LKAKEEAWTPTQGTLFMQVEKTKAFDKLFLEQGVEEEDIQRAVKEHNLVNSAEMKLISE